MRQIRNAIAFLIVNALITQTAIAQCNAFMNADSANALKRLYPYRLFTIGGVAVTDIDNDGDDDLYFGLSFSTVENFENNGNANHLQLTGENTLPQPNMGVYSGEDYIFTDMEFADLDGDGDKDFFVTLYSDMRNASRVPFMVYSQNVGTPAVASFNAAAGVSALPNAITDSLPNTNGCFTFYDVDKDGDLDFTYTNISGAVELYLNTGCRTAPVFTYYATLSAVTTVGKPQYYDWNKDGLPDLFVSGKLYDNVGTLAAPRFAASQKPPTFSDNSATVLTDMNNDGVPEFYSFTGNLQTLTPVPILDTERVSIDKFTVTKLYSRYTSPDYTYNWVFNGQHIPGYHKPFIIPRKKGTYSLEITNNCGTGVSWSYVTNDTRYTDPGMFGFIAQKTIPSLQQQAAVLKSWPNPFSSEINIQLPAGSSDDALRVRITDMAGRTVLDKPGTAGSILAIGNNLSKGMFTLQVWQKGNLIYHQLILKQ